MDADKLAKMQASVRTGGKGTMRRKKKVVHKTGGGDDKKLTAALKKLGVCVNGGCNSQSYCPQRELAAVGNMRFSILFVFICSQCNPIPGFEEANMFLENGNVIHFKAPKIQANLQSKVIAISGTGQEKSMNTCCRKSTQYKTALC